eukprot:TRINITY_DN4157_c0_g1_i1.p1 TRINITY_DN4157_c0_g1~~TRINITY_DN4157_c0_g1_i1.p1  ORF type:complete len:723 (-),score=314.04 TRINITY_DN4157_c0_g1_i1:50-2218(-)
MYKSRFLILALAFGQASAQWMGPISGILDDSTSWVGGVVPNLNPTINSVGDPFTVLVDKLTTLTSPLNLGGIGSTPNMIIDGTTLTVPSINIASGSIRIINGGSLNVHGGITVNSTGKVTIDADAHAFTNITGPIRIVQGSATINGGLPLRNKMEISADASLQLNGTHALVKCDFSGLGTLQLTGDLDLDDVEDLCNIDVDVELMGGNIQSSSNAKSLNLQQLNLIGNGNSNIDAILRVADLSVVSGSLAISKRSNLMVLNDLMAPITSTATISGNVTVSGTTRVNSGKLILSDVNLSSNIDIADFASLVFDNVILTRQETKINANSNGVSKVPAGAALSGVGGIVQLLGGIVELTGGIVVGAGQAISKNTIINMTSSVALGNSMKSLPAEILAGISVEAGAQFILENSKVINSRIFNSGIVSVGGTLQLENKAIFQGAPGSTFENLGQILSNSEIELRGFVDISGNFTASAFTLRGTHSASAKSAVKAPVTLVSASLTVGVGALQVQGDLSITAGSVMHSVPQLVPSKALGTLGTQAITVSGSLSVLGNSQLFAENQISVVGTLGISANSTLRVAKALSCGDFSLDQTSKYALDLSSLSGVDVLHVLNNAKLSGSALLTLQLEAVPTIPFDILQYKSRDGSFGSVNVNVNILGAGNFGNLLGYNMKYEETGAVFVPQNVQVEPQVQTQAQVENGASMASLSLMALVPTFFILRKKFKLKKK